jgi:hypothetical protein
MKDYQTHLVRSSAILVDATYVAGNILGLGQSPNLKNFDEIWLDVSFTIGSLTSAEIKVDFSHELLYDLAYDGQTGNFAVGEVVTGGTSGAVATVVSDTDAGAAGTLVVRVTNKGKSGTGFFDNEALTGDASGVAVVNGAMTLAESSISEATWFPQTVLSTTAGTSTVTNHVYSRAVTGNFCLFVPVNAAYARISAKGTGTATGSLMGITALLGRSS